MKGLGGTLESGLGAGTAPEAGPTTGGPASRDRNSLASKILLALSAAHAALLLLSLRAEPGLELTSAGVAGLVLLGILNALAIGTLAARRTRLGWYLLLAFVFAAGARWTSEGVESDAGLFALLAIAAGVFCITDPTLRREHGIAA